MRHMYTYTTYICIYTHIYKYLHTREVQLLSMRKSLGGAPPPRDGAGRVGPALQGGIQTIHIPKGAVNGTSSLVSQQAKLQTGRVSVICVYVICINLYVHALYVYIVFVCIPKGAVNGTSSLVSQQAKLQTGRVSMCVHLLSLHVINCIINNMDISIYQRDVRHKEKSK
jgi:hypothetical protein